MSSNLIVGGEAALPSRYPYTAAISKESGRFPTCAGTLISPNVVLTAAHCGDVEEVFIGCYNILERFDNTQSSCEVHTVKERIVHPDFETVLPSERKDFALLVLNNSSNVTPIAYIPSTGFNLEDKQRLKVVGWGSTSFLSFNRPTTLRETSVEVVSSESCNDNYQQEFDRNLIRDDMFCAGLPGKDACQADSGGPALIECDLLEEDILVGVISWGRDCALPEFPGVYARVTFAFDFIASVVEENGHFLTQIDNIEEHCLLGGTKSPTVTPTLPTSAPTLPNSWTCEDFQFDSLDGCHCNCGAVDPDCSNSLSSSRLFNCDVDQFCNSIGQCSVPTSSPTSSTPTLSPTSSTPSFSPTTQSPTSTPTVVELKPMVVTTGLTTAQGYSVLVGVFIISFLLGLLFAFLLTGLTSGKRVKKTSLSLTVAEQSVDEI